MIVRFAQVCAGKDFDSQWMLTPDQRRRNAALNLAKPDQVAVWPKLKPVLAAHPDISVEFSRFGGLNLSDVDVEEPDRVALELLTLGFVTLNIRQP